MVGLTTFIFHRLGIVAAIDNGFNALGFDAERVALLDAFTLALLSSMLVGFLLQRRGPTWLGGFVYFVFSYLLHFVQLAMHPGPGPNGQGQILIPGALESVLLTMCGLAFLLSATGAVLGQSLGQLMIAPMLVLARHIWGRLKRQKAEKHIPFVVPGSLVCGSLIIGVLIISVLGVSPLLTYGPTTNLYQSTGTDQLVQHGQVLQGTFPSVALGGVQRNYWIYLPPSYTRATSQRYPTLYLLHGSPGGPADWFVAGHAALTADVLIAEKKIPGMILVSADGNGPFYHFSEWANSFDGRQRMEDAIAIDLVAFIDSHYRTIAQVKERFLGGLSMGGYGAMNIGFHHPAIFHKIISLGGYYQAEGPVFGSGSGSVLYRQLNSPSLFLHRQNVQQALAQNVIIIGVGTTDKQYYHYGITLYQQLHLLKLHAYLLTHTGGHSWALWADQLREAMPILATTP